MKRVRIRVIFLVQLVLLAAICLALPTYLSAEGIRHITMKDGLSSRQVYELEEDADGFIWMYTNSGLERYDGYRFRHYSLDDSEESNDHLASATTMQLGNDSLVWVAIKSGVIYRYDKTLDRFIKQIEFDDKSIGVYHFAILDDDVVVIGTNKGVYICAPGETPRRIALDGALVSAVVADDDGIIYAGTDKGVYSIVLGEGITSNNRSREVTSPGKATKLKGTEGIYVKSLAIASGRLYVGPFADNVFAIDLRSGRKCMLPFRTPPIPVNAMTVYGDDGLLIGVDGAGVYMIDSRDGRLIRHYRDGDNTRYELSGSTVSDILVDRDGGIWISTSHSGVNYLPSHESSLTVLRPERGNSNSILSSHVNAVYEDSYGERWFGTDKGVSRYNPSTGRWRHYLENHEYSANVVLTIGEDAYGNIWVGSYGEGASCIDRNTHEVKHLPELSADGKNGTGTRYIFTSYCDREGNVWLGGINGLTTKYNIKDNTYRYYDEDCIALACPGRNNHVILGGNRGIGIYDPAVDSVRWKMQFDSIAIRYPVRSLLMDTINAEAWIGTMGEGLIQYDYKTDKVRRFTTADGLNSNTIYSILRDNIGGTWICTESDIYRYNPKTESLARFTNFASGKRDIDQLAFNPGGFVARNGDVLLASPEGCIVFNPESDAIKLPLSPLMFTNLILNDEVMTPGVNGSPLSKNINLVESLELDHKYNNIAIDFAVINLQSPNRVDYEYMLEGYDTEFKKSDASRRAKYSALDPGKYKLIVRAIDLYSSTCIDERELPVVIRSPWWQSWWAKLSYVVIILTLIVLCIGYLRNRRREKRVENQIRTFATIAHDIRTPMSMIKAPLINVEQEQGLSEQGRRNLTIARAGIEKTLNMLTAMLELPGGKVGRDSLQIEVCDIRKFIRSKCHEFMSLAMLKNLELTSDIGDDMPVMVVTDIDKLNHVVDNLLSNAIKYTFAGKIEIIVRKVTDKRWSLSVKDTGIGIPKADIKRIFNYRHRGSEAISKNIPGTGMGLLITRRIVHVMRGKIMFTSQSGKGTEFMVELPLNYGKKYPMPVSEPIVEENTSAEDVREEEMNDGRNRIFIIDDDADMRSFLHTTLGAEYDVVVFSDPAELLERIRKESPDMVIADVMMPKLRGDEICRIIKTDMATSHIPVILLSGLTARRDVVSGLEAHADDYIVKPFDLILLKARIRNIIENRRSLSRQVLAEDSKPEEAEFSSELDRQFMVTLMEKLNERLADSDFSVTDLCAEMGMSRTSVYNKIRSITGQSVNEFIRIVRLNKAKELLSSGLYNVSEVAYMVGFADPKYFSTCFKKQFGVSPSKFGS